MAQLAMYFLFAFCICIAKAELAAAIVPRFQRYIAQSSLVCDLFCDTERAGIPVFAGALRDGECVLYP
ncbi:MAG: hypothetical protein DYG89_46965 [Caldilinea sp. CFX5]|nr:hypothetical protein [Caldilinea sp. CFX5]